MNNKFFKKILLFLITLLLIISITITIIALYLKNDNNEYIEDGEDIVASYGKNQRGGIDEESYFDLKTCMQLYLDNVNIKSPQYYGFDEQRNYVRLVEETEIKQNIYNLLSNKFITEKGITIENLYTNVKVVEKPSIFVPIEASLIQDGEIKSFLICGLAESINDYSVIEKIFAIVNIDIVNSRFSVEPIYGQYNNISQIKIEKLENTIISNDTNKLIKSYIKAEDFPKEYINTYKRLALGAPEEAYKLLDEEYKNAKFKSIDEFKNHIQKNKEKITSAKLQKYEVNVYNDNKVRYICIDQHENYYIINQNEILQDYTIMLDKYTIDLPEFIEKYDNSDNNVKVALNIEKLIEATKAKDYKYVYNKLDETFKSSNFKTQQDFENYIKEKYNAEQTTITYEKYEEITGVHIYNIKATEKGSDKEISAKVVMQLKDERDFVFSFSAQN